jgi:hypothetical protein
LNNALESLILSKIEYSFMTSFKRGVPLENGAGLKLDDKLLNDWKAMLVHDEEECSIM